MFPAPTLRIFPEAQTSVKPGHVWMGQEKAEAEYRRIVEEGRLIYEFEALCTYGMF